MIKKISALFLIFVLIFTFFSCAQTPVTETATQQSGADSAPLKDYFSVMESQLSEAGTVTAAEDKSSFTKQLKSDDAAIVAYEGSEDIKIKTDSGANKSVTVKTSGSVTLSSPIGSLVINGADEGFTAKAKADSIVIEGTDLTADIKSETGAIIVKGKDVILNVSNSNIEKLIVLNIYTTVNNLTKDEIAVTLANGTNVIVPAGATYNAQDNTLQK